MAEALLRFFLPEAAVAARLALALALGGVLVGFRRVELLDLDVDVDVVFAWFVSITPGYANHDHSAKFLRTLPRAVGPEPMVGCAGDRSKSGRITTPMRAGSGETPRACSSLDGETPGMRVSTAT